VAALSFFISSSFQPPLSEIGSGIFDVADQMVGTVASVQLMLRSF
jgi:hypothetical protein